MPDRLATITAELDTASGRRVDDVRAATLAEEAATVASHAEDDFYVLVPDLWEPGVYTAVFSDGSSARYVPIEPTPESHSARKAPPHVNV